MKSKPLSVSIGVKEFEELSEKPDLLLERVRKKFSVIGIDIPDNSLFTFSGSRDEDNYRIEVNIPKGETDGEFSNVSSRVIDSGDSNVNRNVLSGLPDRRQEESQKAQASL